MRESGCEAVGENGILIWFIEKKKKTRFGKVWRKDQYDPLFRNLPKVHLSALSLWIPFCYTSFFFLYPFILSLIISSHLLFSFIKLNKKHKQTISLILIFYYHFFSQQVVLAEVKSTSPSTTLSTISGCSQNLCFFIPSHLHPSKLESQNFQCAQSIRNHSYPGDIHGSESDYPVERIIPYT